MAISFDFYHSPSTTPNGEEKEPSFHARVVGGQTIETDDLIQSIHKRSTLSEGDIRAVISELSNEIEMRLLNGDKVNIQGIGIFSLSLKAPKDANPKKTHAQHIDVKRIEYRADYRLKEQVMNKAEFVRSREKIHSAHISIYEVDALLIDYFEEHNFITRKNFEELCHFTSNTAARHLKRLVEEGRLINTNTPHSPTYEPVKGYYNRNE